MSCKYKDHEYRVMTRLNKHGQHEFWIEVPFKVLWIFTIWREFKTKRWESDWFTSETHRHYVGEYVGYSYDEKYDYASAKAAVIRYYRFEVDQKLKKLEIARKQKKFGKKELFCTDKKEDCENES